MSNVGWATKPLRPPRWVVIYGPTPGEAEIDWDNDSIRYYVATVPGPGPVAMRRCWLPYDGEGRSWDYLSGPRLKAVS